MLGLRRFGLSTTALYVKRAFDVTVAAAGLLALAPVMAAVAVLVYLDSPGSIFFRQVRVGRHGRRFEMLKFRSMVVDAEQRKAALADRNETEGFFKITDDPRITRVGRVLRKTSLDEIPQFFNVLMGHMSIVGPRPERTELAEQLAMAIPYFEERMRDVKPGITGLAQIGRASCRERVCVLV